MKEIDKLIQLLLTDDKNNWVLCYELCKANRISFKSVVSKIFHNMKYWKEVNYSKTVPRYIKISGIEINFKSNYYKDNYRLVLYDESKYEMSVLVLTSDDEIINYLVNLIKIVIGEC